MATNQIPTHPERIWTAYLPDGRMWAYGYGVPSMTGAGTVTVEELQRRVQSERDQPACIAWLLWTLSPRLPGLWGPTDPWGLADAWNTQLSEADRGR